MYNTWPFVDGIRDMSDISRQAGRQAMNTCTHTHFRPTYWAWHNSKYKLGY